MGHEGETWSIPKGTRVARVTVVPFSDIVVWSYSGPVLVAGDAPFWRFHSKVVELSLFQLHSPLSNVHCVPDEAKQRTDRNNCETNVSTLILFKISSRA